MNLPAKVFVIVNLVLGVIFATLSVSLYAKKVNFAEQAEAASAMYNAEKKKVDGAITKAENAAKELEIAKNDFEGKLAGAAKTITSLQAINAAQARDNEELKTSISQSSAALNGIREDLKGMLKAKVILENRIKGLTAELKKADSDRMLAQRQSVEISANMNELEKESLALRKQSMDLNERLLAANNTLKEYQKRFGGLEAVVGPADPVRGEVFKVFEETDLVIIRLGSNDNIKQGMEMMISRGDQYVSKVTINNVENNICSALINKELTEKPIRVGDIAETL